MPNQPTRRERRTRRNPDGQSMGMASRQPQPKREKTETCNHAPPPSRAKGCTQLERSLSVFPRACFSPVRVQTCSHDKKRDHGLNIASSVQQSRVAIYTYTYDYECSSHLCSACQPGGNAESRDAPGDYCHLCVLCAAGEK